MAMASTSFTEGSGWPKDAAVPKSLIGAPPRVTVPPGWLEACSMGICGLVAAHPMTKKQTPKTNVKNPQFFAMQKPPSFEITTTRKESILFLFIIRQNGSLANGRFFTSQSIKARGGIIEWIRQRIGHDRN
jgi:hypothetical protein